MLTSTELRQKYLDFFKSKNHAIIGSASLIPENDPTVLFTTAGMHPLVPYLLGQKHPSGTRLADVQKCVRTGDIDEVGDTSHFTFFEMLGNWSLGDYFKEDSIKWSFEFLTDKKWLGLDIAKLAVTVFEGDTDAPRDEFSADVWKKAGMPEIESLICRKKIIGGGRPVKQVLAVRIRKYFIGAVLANFRLLIVIRKTMKKIGWKFGITFSWNILKMKRVSLNRSNKKM